jgi:CDP-glycerol glycerophosphotransferase
MPQGATPDVTVTIIVYNDAPRLPRAVRSVLAQTLNNLEVIIVDDCSTDETPQVGRELAVADPRVRYLRLAENSGGCSAPRNRGIEEARAPFLMFLDSDDELPRHACKSLLSALEETGADFATGEVERIIGTKGKTSLWYPELFEDYRVCEGIRAEPDLLFDHLSTNKMYRADFIAQHALRFPEGIHYEDQLFSVQTYTRAKSFLVVPWVVYLWHLDIDETDENQTSISNSRHKIENLKDRIAIARRVDEYLVESGNADLKAAKDFKFLRHDFRLYLGDLPFRDQAWIEEFVRIAGPYLDSLAPEAYARLIPSERICIHLLYRGRIGEAVEEARRLLWPAVAPKRVVRDAGRVYWGTEVPQDEAGLRMLDLTEQRIFEQTPWNALLRHEAEQVTVEGTSMRLRIKTYDPGRILPDQVDAALSVATVGGPRRTRFTLVRQPDGDLTGEVLFDLAKVPVPVHGFAGLRRPRVEVTVGGVTNDNMLLAPLDLQEQEVTFNHRPVLGVGSVNLLSLGRLRVRIFPEGRGAQRVDLEWERLGVLRAMTPLGPAQRSAKRRLRGKRRQLLDPDRKGNLYERFVKLPLRDDLVVFEAMEGRGYTDSPRYIYEELRRRNLPLNVVWSYAEDRSSFPADVRLVKRGSIEYVRTLARAKYWVDSHNLPRLYRKRTGNRYLQTWHGQTLKTIGYDTPALRLAGPLPRAQYQEQVDRWDLLVSPSAEFERTFIPANNYTGEIVRSGYPRNDVLVRKDETEQLVRRAATRELLHVPDGKRLLFYAPTFRDGERGTGASIRVDLARLAELFGEDWIVVVRAHYYDEFTVDPQLGPWVRDGASFVDVNDLVLASDALLTDYSSLMFDYANTGRPILLYTDDYEVYQSSSRGTYYDLEEIAPGPMLETVEDLAKALLDLDAVVAQYAERYAAFREMFCSYETGFAAKQVVDAFFGEEGQNR